jgi:putative hemolysin
VLLKHYEQLPVATRPKARFELRLGSFVVKLAEGSEELESAIRLRSTVFRDDFGAKVATHHPLWDFDELDRRAEHLIVRCSTTGQTVGTYRLLLSNGTQGFYSQSEFDLSRFLTRPGMKLELSRACVHPHYRNGAVVILLWKGLSEFIRRFQATVLFGCSSVLSEDPSHIKIIMNHLEAKGCIEDRYGITSTPDFKMPLDHIKLDSLSKMEGIPELPPLLRMYLKAGARIAPEPAHDRDFRCVDLFTILEIDQIHETMARRFGFR